MRLLSKDPSERPESATDVRLALESIDLGDDSASVGAGLRPAHEDEANALDSLAGGVFVGRQAEMGSLKAALEDALSGRGRMVTLVGEPGIGKTRTAQELVTYARLRGCQVLWGRSYEDQGVPPYWPWVQAIRGYVRETDEPHLTSAMGSGAADIAEIVPDVRTALPGLPKPPQLESPEQARFRLFDSITSFLRSASLSQPIVLVLDDLHWSDKPSLMLLQFVARELGNARQLLIGTYRDVELNRQHPLAETLGELTRERLFERVLLRGLTQGDVSRFIEVASGISAPQSLARAVHTQTEGNPLFVTEVVRLLVQEGELTAQNVRERDSWEIRVPEGVREVIGRRLNRLSERCNETLTVASVIGREFSLEQLDRLIEDQTADMLLDVLEEALRTRLIEEMPSAIGTYQFTHALVQETLVDELTLTRRVRLHARIAEMLESLWANDLEAHAAELAHHFAQAEAVLGTDRLVKYSIMAGERAFREYAYEVALSSFKRGIAAKRDSANDAEMAALLNGLADSRTALDMRPDGIVSQKNAFDCYVAIGDIPNAIKIASYPFFQPQAPESRQIVEGALKLIDHESHEAGKILAKHGFLQAFSNPEQGLPALQQAVRIGERFRDDNVIAWSLARQGLCLSWMMRWREAAQVDEKAISYFDRTEDLEGKLTCHSWASASSLVLGDGEALRFHADTNLAYANEFRSRFRLYQARNTSIRRHLAFGEWDAMREVALTNLDLDPNSYVSSSALALTEFQTGNLDEYAKYLAMFQETISDESQVGARGLGFGNHVGGYQGFVIPLIAHMGGGTLDFDVASSLAVSMLSHGQECVRVEANMYLALLAVVRSETEKVSGRYEELLPFAGIYFSLMATDHLLGLLAHTMGDLDTSAVHFEDALAFCREAGYRPELAWSLCDYADMLRERDAESDRDKAVALLDESLAISTELGMKPLMERVLSRRDILKA